MKLLCIFALLLVARLRWDGEYATGIEPAGKTSRGKKPAAKANSSAGRRTKTEKFTAKTISGIAATRQASIIFVKFVKLLVTTHFNLID